MSLFSRLSSAWHALRSLENPSTSLADPDDWLYDAFGASPSSSGVSVSAESALKYPPVWRCTNLISRDVAKLPLLIYQREGDGKRRANEHPAFALVRRKPNSEMTAFAFWQLMMCRALLRGNGVAYIFRRGDGSPMELVPLDPDTTYGVRVDGTFWYVTKVGNEERKLPARDVLHVKGLSSDGLWGYPITCKARDSWGRGIGAGEYASRFFANDARPSIVLEHPGKLSDNAQSNLRKSWSAKHQGIENWHKPAILEEGMKVNAFSINARDAQLLELRQFEIREVANWFCVPPHKVGDSSRTSYNSLESENQAYLDDALDPWLVSIEQEVREKLLTEEQKAKDTHVIEFMRQALVRADMSTRSTFYHNGLLDGWLCRDEVRSYENLNPIPDGEGKKFYVPANMTIAGEEPPPAPAPPGPVPVAQPDESARDAALDALEDAVRRMVKRLATHADKALRKGQAVELESHRAKLVEAISPAAALIRSVGGTADPNAIAGRLIEMTKPILPDASHEKQQHEIATIVRASTGLEES